MNVILNLRRSLVCRLKKVLSVNLNSRNLLNPLKIATGTIKNFKPTNSKDMIFGLVKAS